MSNAERVKCRIQNCEAPQSQGTEREYRKSEMQNTELRSTLKVREQKEDREALTNTLIKKIDNSE